MFDAATYRARRDGLRQYLRDGLVLLAGNTDAPINFADNLHPFRQDSSFLYYFGIDQPGLWGLMDLEQGSDFLYGRDAGPDERLWTGPRPSIGDLSAAAGAAAGGVPEELVGVVRDAFRRGQTVHYLPPYRADQVLVLMRMTGQHPDTVKSGASAHLVRAVVAMRSRKSAEEIAEVESALERAGSLFAAAGPMIRVGTNVLAVAGEIDRQVRRWGARLAFPMIVTVRGEVLHGSIPDTVMADGDLLLADIGVESPRCYASDLTRTFPVSGRFSTRQREIYQIVLDAQNAAIAAMAPGVAFRDVHLTAATEIARGLAALGLMKGSPEAAAAEGAHALFFPHGLGHLLGLDVHDMEGLGEDAVGYDDTIGRDPRFGFSALRFGRRLEPGHILTVEPGIYFIDELIDRWAAEGRFADFIDYQALVRYRGFGGIRIEDDVLVTASGCRALGPAVPKTIEAVEAAVGALGEGNSGTGKALP